jgi:hypothetical protein
VSSLFDELDAIRGRALRLFGPFAPVLLRDRERRVAVYGITSIAVALALTFAAPLALLAIGPLVLGVPHLIGDVRYLVARPGLHRRLEFWLFVAGPACMAFVHPHAWISMTALVGAAMIARASWAPRALVALVGFALVLLCVHFERLADLALAHAHNAIAVALFWMWSRRSARLHGLILAFFAIGVVAIGLGAFDAASFMRLARERVDDVDPLVSALAPLSDPILAARLVLTFAFAQSVHYAVWVRLIPEQDRDRPGLRSFSSSLRALVADLGRPIVVLSGLVAAALALWGCFSLISARDGYLRIAIFHGPLELGAAGLLLLEGGRGTIRSRPSTAA